MATKNDSKMISNNFLIFLNNYGFKQLPIPHEELIVGRGVIFSRWSKRGELFEGGVIRGMGSYYFESVILPKGLRFLLKPTFHMTIGIRQQRITPFEQVEKRLSTK